MDGNYDEMIKYKEKAIVNNPYTIYEYENYVSLLSRAIDETDGQERNIYIEKLLEIPQMLEKQKEKTGELGWKIKDSPELELSEEFQLYIEQFSP